MDLYGQSLSRREVAALSGSLSQFAGVRQMTLGDGVERGVRMLEFRSGTGLRFTVMVDRCLDIAECEFNGMALGWCSPAGFPHPGLHDYEGEGGLGFLRSFSGLLMTCGLDHILFNHETDAEHFLYRGRDSISHSIHGRVNMIPARLTGYGERWEEDRCFLWCEGVVRQAAVFGEHLELVRRIEIEVGSNDIRLHDEVRNAGFYRTPHMYLYHVNVGYPVLAEGARYLAPIRDVIWAAHAETYRDQGVGYRVQSGPQEGYREQVWQHEMAPNAYGEVSVALVNDALAIGFEVVTRKDQLPCNYQWQNLQAGSYAMGLEPATHHVIGEGPARERGEMIFLEHGQSRRYDATFRVLGSAEAIADCEARITAVCGQPQEDYPALSGAFPPLHAAA